MTTRRRQIARLTAVAAVLLWLAAPRTAAQTASTLPTARAILDRFVEAVGGREAVLRHTSRREVGTFEVPSQQISGTLEVLAAAPDRMLVRVRLPGLGEIMNGFDGRVAWSVSPMTGPMLLEGEAHIQTQMDADFYSELHDPARFKTIDVLERVTFEGRPVYKLQLVRPSGEQDLESFAVDDGLLVGTVVTRASPMGPVQVTSAISDYRDFGGLRLPTRLRQKMMGVEQVMTISTVEFDTLDQTAFAPPPTITGLIK